MFCMNSRQRESFESPPASTSRKPVARYLSSPVIFKSSLPGTPITFIRKKAQNIEFHGLLPIKKREGRDLTALEHTQRVTVRSRKRPRLRLVDAEINLDIYFYGNGFSLQRRGLEFVLLHCFDSLLVQPHAQVANYLDSLRVALSIHDQRNHADALVFCSARFIGELWVRGKHQLRSRDAAAHVVKTAPIPAAFARSIAISFA